jgi:uncharacterized protein YbjT (DUF2867 family)
MRVLVTGGTGVFGRYAVRRLVERGHAVCVLSRQAAPALPAGVTAVRGDLVSADGLPAAMAGVEAILHAASNTGRGQGKGDVEGTQFLATAAEAAHVTHLLYVSIVGIEHIPIGYYKRKLACEHIVAHSGVRHTIFRATQFHELIEMVLRAVEGWPMAPLPLAFRFQPVAAEEAAARAVELLEAGPQGRGPDFGGPEVLTLGSMVSTWRSARGGRPRVITLPLFGRAASGFRRGLNTCPSHADGKRTWSQHVAALPG